jgi:hypothetical protein
MLGWQLQILSKQKYKISIFLVHTFFDLQSNIASLLNFEGGVTRTEIIKLCTQQPLMKQTNN